MKKRVLACLTAGAMTLSVAACGGDSGAGEAGAGSTPESSAPSEAPLESAAPLAASIDFEDGNMGFAAVYTQKANAAAVELSLTDFNGSKALQAKYTHEGSRTVPYVAIDASSLLGEKAAQLKKMEASVGISYENGAFSSVAGKIYAWSGAELAESYDDWSVYVANKNPNTVTAVLDEGEAFVPDANNIFILSLETDNGVTEGNGNATLYIDDIRFLDGDGNLLTADSGVAFAAPEGFEGGQGVDLSNLAALSGAIEVEGFAVSADGWAQAGVELTQEQLDALSPGSVIQIEYASESGDMWVLFNAASVGWRRCGQQNEWKEGTAYINASKNIAQITYEQLETVYGADKSTWGTSLQCESSGAWEVYSVKIGKAVPVIASLANAVEVEGFAVSADGWAQAGVELTQEQLDALVPGSAIEVSFSSESNDMWVLFNAASVGWRRCGQQNEWGEGTAVISDGKAYITYEQLETVYGSDKSGWGTSLQCEASGAWEVYSVRIGTPVYMHMVNNLTPVEGFTASGDGWTQAGMELTQEQLDALETGSVLEVAYTSETGDMWVLFNAASVGWRRCGQQNEWGEGFAACNGSVCQVTYEQLAAVYGEDKSAWGTSLQCESSGAWEVYSVSIGKTPIGE